MSGSVGLSAPSYLPALFGSTGSGDSLLATLYGYSGPNPGSVNPIAALEQAKAGETRQVAVIAAEPQIKRDIAQFTQALATAKTPAQLLANPAAMKVLADRERAGRSERQYRAGDQGAAVGPVEIGFAGDATHGHAVAGDEQDLLRSRPRV